MLNKIKQTITNADGTLNGKVLTGLISALILLAQQVVGVFGIEFKGSWDNIQAIFNTILTVLTIVGVVSIPSQKE